MKSRVQKNHELYETLASSVEEKVESSDLSDFANQLNDIDTQFERMNIMNQESHDPIHAKETHADNDLFSSAYDTFENEYLKDFLEEVKEYNVKKGYRTSEDTQSNILHALTGTTFADRNPREMAQETDAIESLVSSIEKNQDVVEDVNQTKEYIHAEQEHHALEPVEDADDPAQSIETLFHKNEVTENTDELEDLSLSDSKELQLDPKMNANTEWEADEISLTRTDTDETPLISETAEKSTVNSFEIEHDDNVDLDDTPTVEASVVENVSHDVSESVDLNRLAIEETKTLQLKLEEQQRDLQTISKSMVNTNRILNSVIAIVLLCFFLVVAFIVKMFWFN